MRVGSLLMECSWGLAVLRPRLVVVAVGVRRRVGQLGTPAVGLVVTGLMSRVCRLLLVVVLLRIVVLWLVAAWRRRRNTIIISAPTSVILCSDMIG